MALIDIIKSVAPTAGQNIAADNYHTIAEAVNATSPTQTVSTFVNHRTILANFADGVQIIAALQAAAPSNAALGYMLPDIMSTDGIDVSLPGTIAALKALGTANVLTQAQVSEILNLAVQPIVYTWMDCEKAVQGN